jgi:hypothetical protein
MMTTLNNRNITYTPYKLIDDTTAKLKVILPEIETHLPKDLADMVLSYVNDVPDEKELHISNVFKKPDENTQPLQAGDVIGLQCTNCIIPQIVVKVFIVKRS